jgi:RNA 2',3'-cyclic 3'-phosphodiesterase
VSDLRCFVALELEPHIVATLLEAGSALRAADLSWRDEKWVAAENLHITLKFIGTLAEQRASALVSALGAAMAEQRAFRLQLADVSAVPSPQRSSMVWATFRDAQNHACMTLASRVEAVAAQFDVPAEDRRFAPHVTLVRARRPKRLDSDALARANTALTCSAPSMSVSSTTLFASMLTRQGPVYEQLARWDFSEAR